MSYDIYYYIKQNTHNIFQLSRIQNNYFNYKILKNKNRKLSRELNNYKHDYNKLKRQISDISDYIECCDISNKRKKNETKSDNFTVIKYEINENSWDEEKINKTISSINSITDIVNLNPYWENIKHNEILQKLYYLIPPLIKLTKMVGLKEIKEDLFKKIIYYITNSYEGDYLHTVIIGSPGVGKTEFAKIYADIYVRLNILKSNKFIEVKRDDFIAEYLGQTAIKTRKLLDDSLNGVIFLDEAYSMGNKENRDSFSKEAIDMINQYLSEQKDKLMFIIAGYEKDINECFFAYNKGLHRRFHTKYTIGNYTYTDLYNIFFNKITDLEYNLSGINKNILENFFKDNFSNFTFYGGDIEKLINEIKHVQSIRLFRNNLKNKDVLLEDIQNAFDTLFKTSDRENTHSFMSMYI